MDKLIWLSVIREELGLLNSLATGMIEDARLTREEVELAIARAKLVVGEFEMLQNSLPATTETETVEKAPIPETVPEPFTPVEAVSPEIQAAETKEVEPVVEEIPVSETPVEAPTVPAPEPAVAAPLYPVTEVEAPAALDLEVKKEEPTPFKAAPLKSLREGLSLNDRYLFQRELFNHDKSKLDEAVATLDRMADIHEAVGYLKANFRWNKSEASEKFVQLVKRRFS